MASEATGLSAVATRYAGALYELAEPKNQLDDTAKSLKTVKTLLGESAELRRFVGSPIVGRDKQAKAMSAVLAKAGVTDLVARFVAVITKNGRLAALGEIAEAFLRLLATRRGEVTVEVRTAQPLAEREMQALGQALKPIAGDKVAFDVKVDPSILGGLIVKVGSRMFDSSLRTKLQRLQLAMKGVA